MSRRTDHRRLVHAALLLGVAVVVARCAWVSDDAFITLRTLENLCAGRGLTYNPVERVQAFTHPLWALWLMLPYAITREPWITTMAVGGLTSLGAVAVLLREHARSVVPSLTVVAALLSSKAWVDYATAGLETPLVCLLLALFARDALRRAPLGRQIGWAALLCLTRLDVVLLVLPSLVHAAWGRRPRSVLQAQVAWLPLLLWLAAAWLYYGTPLPNTAYAKLGTGIPRLDLAAQSLHYAGWTLRHDPTTLPLLLGGLTSAAIRPTHTRTALAAGVGLYLGYVAWIGGDFMGGRFFVAPLWVAVILLSRARLRVRHHRRIAVGAVVVSLLSAHAPLRSGPGYTKAPPSHGVVDERGYYWAGTGLYTSKGFRRMPTHDFAVAGRTALLHPPDQRFLVKSVIGLFGYYAGPDVHIVDRLGLADPLLARLPVDTDRPWRIGHFRRTLPAGYRASLPDGPNRLEDPSLAARYDAIRLRTRGPLLRPARMWLLLTDPVAR